MKIYKRSSFNTITDTNYNQNNIVTRFQGKIAIEDA